MTVPVALVGPAAGSRGGIAASSGLLCAAMRADEFMLVPVVTYRDGGKLAKARTALVGLGRLAVLCVHGRVGLVHVQVSAGGASLCVRRRRSPWYAGVASGCSVPAWWSGAALAQFGSAWPGPRAGSALDAGRS